MPSSFSRGTEASPPPVMTWGKASLPLGIALVFDAFGFIFSLFGIFGPVLAGLAAGSYAGGGVIGTAVGGATAGLTAFFGSAGLQAFGIVMAMAVGFFGWMTVGFMMLMSNARIFKGGNMLWFGGALIIDQIPFVNSLPALTPVTYKMYRSQIKADKKAFAEYEKNRQQLLLQQRRQQELQLRNLRMQQIALAEQEAANDAAIEEAANEIPEQVRRAS